jgi:sulfhydrogenase subunit alpha
VRWVAGFDFPDVEADRVFLSLSHPDEYPLNEGRLVTSRGLDVPVSAFEEHVKEEHVPHSTALHAAVDGEPYLVGPLARYALNHDRLSPLAQEAAREAGLGPVVRNPFQSIVVRAVELVYACDEALRIVDAYEAPERAHVEVPPRAGRGPRLHRGAPRHALPPLHDQRRGHRARRPHRAADGAEPGHDRAGRARRGGGPPRPADRPALQHLCEQAVRNHDPCISCATHFLKLDAADALDRVASLRHASSHSLGVAAAIGLARALGALPGRLVVYAIEVRDSAEGEALSPEVDAAARRLADRLAAGSR